MEELRATPFNEAHVSRSTQCSCHTGGTSTSGAFYYGSKPRLRCMGDDVWDMIGQKFLSAVTSSRRRRRHRQCCCLGFVPGPPLSKIIKCPEAPQPSGFAIFARKSGGPPTYLPLFNFPPNDVTPHFHLAGLAHFSVSTSSRLRCAVVSCTIRDIYPSPLLREVIYSEALSG